MEYCINHDQLCQSVKFASQESCKDCESFVPDRARPTSPDGCTYRIFGDRLMCSVEQTNEFVLLLTEAYVLVMSRLLLKCRRGLFCQKLARSFPPLMAALHSTLHIPSSLSPTLTVRTLWCLFPSSQHPVSLIFPHLPPDAFSACHNSCPTPALVLPHGPPYTFS